MTSTAKLLSVSTAVPPYKFDQQTVKDTISQIYSGPRDVLEKLMPIYQNSGILNRYSCVPMDWYRNPVGWEDKNKLFIEHSLDLLEQAATTCFAEAGRAVEEVDALVVVTSSGIATPTLDARLMQRMAFRQNVQRLPIFGLGCAGGTLGLARAASLARDGKDKLVLFLVVELCGLTFRQRDSSKSGLIATALFGDGAAGALISCKGVGPELIAWGEHTWPDTLDIMGWNVMDDGLAVQFSRDIPSIIHREVPAVIDDFLHHQGLKRQDIQSWICHPGGAKVLAAYEDALGLDSQALDHSRNTLRDYGNMSAATVLFVLKQALITGIQGRSLLTSLGPGFSTGFLLMES